MNKPFVIILSIYVLFSLVSLNGKAQDLTTGLISVWELDETGLTFYDALGNHNGSNQGAETNIVGILGKCVNTNSSDYINVGNSVDFDGGNAFSVSIWVKTTTANTTKGLMVRDDGTDYKWILYVTGSSFAQLYVRTASGVTFSSDNILDIDDGIWHHIVGVWDRYAADGYRVKCYVDGGLDSKAVGYNEPVIAGTTSTYIGRWKSISAFNGNVDQVGFWKGRALSLTDIQALYNNRIGLPYISWSGSSTPLTGGTISPTSLTINSGQSPGTISSTAAANGGTGTYAYQWQKSTNGSSYTDISGASTTSYTAPTLTQNTWYRRKVTDGTSTVAYSNVSAITVNTVLSGGTISPSSLTITSGQSPGTISSTTAASGGAGSYTYQWQNSTNGSSYTDISSGANSATYTPPALTQNTWYRRKVTDGALTVAYSNVSAITVTTSGTSCLWNDHTNYISYEGPVGINTSSNPDNYELIVNGEIRAKEVVVETGWADYVFENDYSLLTLDDLENYILINKHLPEIPSAVEVEKNGIDLGEMNMLLLRKIEELTLYLISQHKEIEKLKKSDEIINK